MPGSLGEASPPCRDGIRGMITLLKMQRKPYLAGLATNSIFFCFLFVKKSLICLEGKSMTPHRGNTILFRSSQELPRIRLGPLKGFLS